MNTAACCAAPPSAYAASPRTVPAATVPPGARAASGCPACSGASYFSAYVRGWYPARSALRVR